MNRIVRIAFLFLLFIPVIVSAQIGSTQIVGKTVIGYKDTLQLHFLYDADLYNQGWDTLPQTKFWKQVLTLTGDTCIINVASCRQPLQRVCHNNWSQLSDYEKSSIKDSLACNLNLCQSDLFVTKGKSEFYEIKKMLPEISKAIRVFEQDGVDPWYAQTILLIESPGKTTAKSSVGANGPFQLMRTVAKRYGLVVSKKRDDRTNLEKSAKVAAKLLKSSCIPYIRQYLADYNIQYNETDLWFRLLVLHAYHAGAGNVRGVLAKMQPKAGGVPLFTQLWQTECGRFKNESQNYSQIALASISLFEEMIQKDGDTVYLVTGDRKFKGYSRTVSKGGVLVEKSLRAFDYLNQCLTSYENDLVDGTIPFDYFTKHVGKIRKEMRVLVDQVSKETSAYVTYSYPASQEQILSVASRLINKQRFEDAINIIKSNLDARPNSATAYALLAKAYMQNGNRQLAAVYSNRSMAAKESGEATRD